MSATLANTMKPPLSASCGKYLTYRDLIECGSTQKQANIDNIPDRLESYTALRTLATDVLDPVIKEHGNIELTYGFSSAALSRRIARGIAPKLDQHAAHELNKLQNPICPRLGAAADFIVHRQSMLKVAQWVVQNCPFDRLYFYADSRPVHVSVGPDNSRAVVMMRIEGDRNMPRRISSDKFAQL